MELLYFWIEKSTNGVFIDEGFNFSPKYSFKCKRENGYIYLLKDENWSCGINVFTSDIISNVTAVIGCNGSGKSELLSELLGGMGYEFYINKQKENTSSKIYILEESGELYIYHNIENGLKFQLGSTHFTERVASHKNLSEILTCIGLTNSIVVRNESKWLFPNSDSTYSGFPKWNIWNCNEDESIGCWNILIRQYSAVRSFRSDIIWDILYLSKWRNRLDDQINAPFKKPQKVMLEIDYRDALYYIAGLPSSYDGYADERDYLNIKTNTTDDAYGYINNFIQSLYDKTEHLNQHGKCLKYELMLALLSEAILCLEESSEFPHISSYDHLEEYLEEFLEGDELELEGEDSHLCLEDIYTLVDFISPQTENVADNKYSIKEEKISDFIDFIASLISEKRYFILRYINISFPGISSGERAFNNLFSMCNYALSPCLPSYSSSFLLLIDECDLYLHPDWQVKFVDYFIREIEQTYKASKVQIVLATHSPLCLSDIPKENIIFLEKSDREGTAHVSPREEHIQTFARDSYSILNDSFYLKDTTMGLYAKKYINSIIKDINDHNRLEKIDARINVIGNSIVKTALREKCSQNKEYRLKQLREQRAIIDKEIAELEK